MIIDINISLIALRDFQDAQDILHKYKENFETIKEYIDNIIKSLIENITTIPYTLRCICKIINILIHRKVSYYLIKLLIGIVSSNKQI